MKYNWLTPMSPDAPSSTQRDPDGGGTMGGGTKMRHGGAEDYSPEAKKRTEEMNRLHKKWLYSEKGAAWFNSQIWTQHKPLVRVMKLGLQPGFCGLAGVMLYNVVGGAYAMHSTVTIASLMEAGYRVEVVSES